MPVAGEPGPATGPYGLRALIVDYGGVLTTSVRDSLATWAQAEGIEPRSARETLSSALGAAYGDATADHPVHRLERGEMDVADVERILAGRLRTASGEPVAADGLVGRMFAGFRAEARMLDALATLRRRGVATALLSNSWGGRYDRRAWDELFDVVVVSGEVGMRKPEERIYRLVADRLGVVPAACVFVDDHPANVVAAVALGMVGIRHVDVTSTLGELDVLFGGGLLDQSR